LKNWERKNVEVGEKKNAVKEEKWWGGDFPLVGRHVVNETKVA
jgi:hypothetical protein